MHKADYFLPVQEIRNVKATTIVQIVSNFTTPLPQSSYMYTIQGLLKSPQCLMPRGLLVWQSVER